MLYLMITLNKYEVMGLPFYHVDYLIDITDIDIDRQIKVYNVYIVDKYYIYIYIYVYIYIYIHI